MSSTSGSAASSPLSVTASATDTMPAKPSRRRSATVRASAAIEQRAVLVEPRRPAPRRSMPAGRARAAPGRRCGTARPRGRRPRARASACSARCSASPCTGIDDARPHPAVHLLHLGAARMAGDVDQMRAVGDDLDALRDQPVDDAADRLLVAGNGARGEDHAVALATASPRDARPRRCARARRAARPGCRCTAPRPCRAADSRRPRCRGTPARRRDSRSRARPARCAPWRGRPRRPRGRRRARPRRRRGCARRWRRRW